MCEFKVIHNGMKVFEDAVYIKDDGNSILFRNILGQTKAFPKCRIVEVNVEKEELVIEQTS